MADVELISDQQERNLMEAMVGAISDANSGTNPNVAIAKQANAHGFGAEFACRMVEAYNTSKTIRHLSDNTGEKRADTFPLADKAEVIKHMYNFEPPKPQEKKASASKFIDFNRAAVKPAMEKSASVFKSAERETASPLISTTLVKARSTLSRIKWAEDELRREAGFAKEAVMKRAHEFVDLYRTTPRTCFEAIDQFVQQRHGEMGKKAMDILWGMRDFEILGEKRAESLINTVQMLLPGDRFINAAERYIKAIDKSAETAADLYVFSKKAEVVRDYFNTVFGKLGIRKEGQGVEEPPIFVPGVGGAVEAGVDQGQAPQGGGDLASKLMMQAIGSQTYPFMPTWVPGMVPSETPEVEDIVTPEHEREIRAIKMQMMANDMISNDPVLSAYPPDDVLNAINQVSELSPALSTNPLLMRGVVSRVLQQGGHLDPSEIEQLLKTEVERRKTGIMGY